MKRAFVPLVLGALIVPAPALAQDSGDWWAPLSAELTRTATGPTPGYVCDLFPDIPACDDRRQRDGDWERTDDRRRGEARGSETRRRGGGDARRGNARNGNGPPFCRNGQGHPVHGREWCRDKGWGTGDWRDVSWGDVIFGRQDRRRESDRLDRGGLADVLGDVVFGRLESHARSAGGGALNGRFVESQGRLLQVRAGSSPLAELLDIDRDGRVDRMLLFSPR